VLRHRSYVGWGEAAIFLVGDVVPDVPGDWDSFSVHGGCFPRIEATSFDALEFPFEVAFDLTRDTLVRSGLDLALVSALIADSDVPNLAFSP
jgi:hypothetical protein